MLLRDQALSAAGLLQRQLYGKPVYPYQPADIWDGLAITKERDFSYPLSTGSDLYRRSLYTFWRRTVAPANMFDASTRSICSVRSSNTNTPLHALTMLNDVTFLEAARLLAEQVMKTSDLEVQLRHAFRRVLLRYPSLTELNRLRSGHEKQLRYFQENPAEAEKLLYHGHQVRDASLPTAEHAALTVVALTLLNLDETLNRE
jgi:hypothetical protein